MRLAVMIPWMLLGAVAGCGSDGGGGGGNQQQNCQITATCPPNPTPSKDTLCTGQAAPSGYLGLCSDTLRAYQLHLPSPMPSGQLPLIVYLHSWGSSAANHAFDGIADSVGLIVAYPEGTRRTWGEGTGPLWNAGGPFEEATRYTDDVKFIQKLIDSLEVRYPIDRGRVFAFGFSNGGMMAYRLAHSLSSRITGIVSVSGSEVTSPYDNPTQPVGIMHVHGLKDTSVPFGGGNGFSPVATFLQSWRVRQQCAERADTIANQDSVLGQRWRSPTGRGDVVLFTHPGPHSPPLVNTTVDMSAWTFLKSLPRRPD